MPRTAVVRIPADPNARRCSSCFRAEPDVKLSASDHPLCESCRVDLRIEKMRAEQSQQLHQVITQALRHSSSLPTFRGIVGQIVEAHPDFAAMMLQDFEQVRDKFHTPKGTGGKLLLEFYKFFMGLFKLANDEQQAENDVASWSDDELQDACDRYLDDRIKRLPSA